MYKSFTWVPKVGWKVHVPGVVMRRNLHLAEIWRAKLVQ